MRGVKGLVDVLDLVAGCGGELGFEKGIEICLIVTARRDE